MALWPRQLESLLDAMPQPVIAIGPDARIQQVNRAAGHLVGDNAPGLHFVTQLRQPALLDAVEATLRDRETRRAEFRTREHGQDITYEVRCVTIETQTGPGVALFFEDITQFESTNQMRRDFVANVSHELKTPLTALMGFIETMLHGPARGDLAAHDRFLRIMESEAGRMNRLVGDLLSLNRVERVERMRPTTPVDLSQLVRSVSNGLAGLAAEADLRIETDLPDARVELFGDEDQLRQVLTNLIDNAIKYGADGEKIGVTLRLPAYDAGFRGNAVELVVRDFGLGIDPLHIPRLTERFYRVDSHRSRSLGGTGLGLAIVKHIVARHRGRVRIQSSPGEGASFHILLPA